MKILLAAKHPPTGRQPVGGVQSWCLTMGNELIRRGHQVVYWGPEFGSLTDKFAVGIFANLEHTAKAVKQCDRVLKISHGIIPAEKGGPDFAATSEEVAQYWGCERGVIRQPIDLDFWAPAPETERTLLVRHSYRQGLPWLETISHEFGLRFACTGENSHEEVRALLQRAAVVVATGRAAVEAMACGAAVVIADDRPYQGPLFDPDIFTAMLSNYSGRAGETATEVNVREGIRQALFCGSVRRAFVKYHHDVKDIVSQVLEIC